MFNSIKKSVSNLKDKAVHLVTGGVALVGANAVYAASVIDFASAEVTNAATDITDTVSGALAFVLPIVIFIVASKVGIRVFKSMTSSMG